MSVKYIPYGSTKVVIGGETYQNVGEKKAVLPVEKISNDELECLLKSKLVVKLELDESGEPVGKKRKAPKKPKTENPNSGGTQGGDANNVGAQGGDPNSGGTQGAGNKE